MFKRCMWQIEGCGRRIRFTENWSLNFITKFGIHRVGTDPEHFYVRSRLEIILLHSVTWITHVTMPRRIKQCGYGREWESQGSIRSRRGRWPCRIAGPMTGLRLSLTPWLQPPQLAWRPHPRRWCWYEGWRAFRAGMTRCAHCCATRQYFGQCCVIKTVCEILSSFWLHGDRSIISSSERMTWAGGFQETKWNMTATVRANPKHLHNFKLSAAIQETLPIVIWSIHGLATTENSHFVGISCVYLDPSSSVSSTRRTSACPKRRCACCTDLSAPVGCCFFTVCLFTSSAPNAFW